MGSQKNQNSDAEDIPSDFFDDFAKDEFIEGLSVIDSWGDEGGGKRRGARINAEAVESVRDLRELIREGKEDERKWGRSRRESPHLGRSARSGSVGRMEDYIKPGSRRDPNKTNEAIRRDKQVKVKQYLAKHLESTDDLRPPGTELDDFFVETKPMEGKKSHQLTDSNSKDRPQESSSKRVHSLKHSPQRSSRRSPRRSPRPHRRSPRRSPRRSLRRSPRRSPLRSLHSPRWVSPQRRQRNRHLSPLALRHCSPRYSPNYSPRWEKRSPSPEQQPHRRMMSISPPRQDSFLYPKESLPSLGYSSNAYQMGQEPFPGPPPNEFPANTPAYPYPQSLPYVGGYGVSYEYGVQPPIPPVPQPVPAPMPNPGLLPHMNPIPTPAPNIPLPVMVPAPPHSQMVSPLIPTNTALQPMDSSTPYDALAQLVAEGKLSQQDYLKLAPNKSKSTRVHDVSASMDTKTRVDVLNRCNTALTKLASLRVPNRLLMNVNLLKLEPKCLAPKFCSPLKRQADVAFGFTQAAGAAAVLHNKQLVDSIITTIGLSNVIVKPKRKTSKNMKDAAVQTTKPYCDVCEIRESAQFLDCGTSIDREHFSSTVHTQVVEHELASSKSVFNPSGSIADGAPISIAHLTPAQLVSQLAARAKTLKQSDPAASSHFERRPPHPYDGYDQDRGAGGKQYQNSYNYRY